MIWNYIFIIVGVGLFGYSYYLFWKEKDNSDSKKVYGAFAYLGTAIAIYGIYQILFVQVLHRFGFGELLIVLAISELNAYLLLNPGFGINKDK